MVGAGGVSSRSIVFSGSDLGEDDALTWLSESNGAPFPSGLDGQLSLVGLKGGAVGNNGMFRGFGDVDLGTRRLVCVCADGRSLTPHGLGGTGGSAVNAEFSFEGAFLSPVGLLTRDVVAAAAVGRGFRREGVRGASVGIREDFSFTSKPR
jgi:hypothetical protein